MEDKVMKSSKENIELYKENIELYKEREKSLLERYNACRKLKQYLKGLDAAIEKRKKTNKASAFQINDSLQELYKTIYF